jgi:predicted ATPase/DNA-binding SARP family transcriptional activator
MMTAAIVLRIHLLGAFRVSVDRRPVPESAWRSKRAASLVQLLALAPGHRLHREQAMETLWPELDLDAQANNLNVAASRARQALASAGAPGGVFVVRHGESLVLGPDDAVRVDLDAFAEASAIARQRNDPIVVRTALAHYTGDLLADNVYEEWIEARRSALRSDYFGLLARLGKLHADRGEVGHAIESYLRLLADEPTHEDAAVAVMRLYAGQGQRSLALTQFDRLREALRRDLGALPEPATRELADAIRSGRYRAEGDRSAKTETVERGNLDNVPLALNDLIGRERELAEIRQLLAIGRLVTLTGPGGIGKTQLALALAHDVRRWFVDGIAFVDLSPIRDPALVAGTIARTLDVRESSGRSPVDGLVGHLRDKRLLLVLDNFEQVAEGAPVLSALLERTPQIKILVTSRTALLLTGEREYPVPPLPVPDPVRSNEEPTLSDNPAVTLFVQRAQAVKPGFRMTEENALAIADVCRRLDGLPLAIELAAARVKVLTPEAMLTRLDRPLALLVGGRRNLPERQQTIRQTIAWSHDLLSEPERRLFRRLAVFVGGWTLEAAEAVVDPDGDLGISVLDGLASLVDKSLVIERDGPEGFRFRMLETIREFGLERLTASDEEPWLRDRHAAKILALAEVASPHLESADQATWLSRLEPEEENFRAALNWARERGNAEAGLRLVIALQQYWFIRGRIIEGRDQLLGIIALPESQAFPALRADALNAVAMMTRDGDDGLAYHLSVESRAISRRIGDRKREADTLANLGHIALQRGDLEDARALFTECLTSNRAIGNAQGIADAVSFLALTAYHRGQLDEARRLNEESLAIWIDLDDLQGIVWARTRLGGVMLRLGRFADAYRQFLTSLEIARQLDFQWGLSWTLDGFAQLALALNAPDVALDLAAVAREIREKAGLRLSAFEQAEIDSLRERVAAAHGDETAAAGWAHRRRQDTDAMIREIGSLLR